MGDHAFDPGLGLFAGLNVLPQCTAMFHLFLFPRRGSHPELQQAFVKRALKSGLSTGASSIWTSTPSPITGKRSVLQEHWAGARGKRMKGALTLFAQDAASKLVLYTAADILKEEANEQVFMSCPSGRRFTKASPPPLSLIPSCTTYEHLSLLNGQGIASSPSAGGARN